MAFCRAVRHPAHIPPPAVSGRTIPGGRLSLAADRGHVIVLNFWGSWCSVCQQEAPALAAARQFTPSGVRFDVADSSASASPRAADSVRTCGAFPRRRRGTPALILARDGRVAVRGQT